MAGHTLGKLQLSFDGIGIPLIDESEQVVALIPVSIKRTPQAERANAARLALCWNEFDNLIMALETIAQSADDTGRLCAEPNTYQQIAQIAHAALAAAKGEG